MTTVAEATKALDVLIASKKAYLAKKPNNFLTKEIEQLTAISEIIKKLEHLNNLTQLSYKLLLDHYAHDFEGKINPKNYPSIQESIDNLHRLTSEK